MHPRNLLTLLILVSFSAHTEDSEILVPRNLYGSAPNYSINEFTSRPRNQLEVRAHYLFLRKGQWVHTRCNTLPLRYWRRRETEKERISATKKEIEGKKDIRVVQRRAV